MSEFLGTPAPWEMEDSGEDFWPTVVKDGQEIAVLANGSMSKGDQYIPGSMDWPVEANARLIAAAPDLLEVLRAYERWEANLIESSEAWAGSGMDGYPHLTSHLWDELLVIQAKRNDAIQKALGAS
jgi:hypothetical protein